MPAKRLSMRKIKDVLRLKWCKGMSNRQIRSLAARLGLRVVIDGVGYASAQDVPPNGPRPDGRPVRLRVVRQRVLCAPCRFTRCPLDHACMTGVSVGSVEPVAAGSGLSSTPYETIVK